MQPLFTSKLLGTEFSYSFPIQKTSVNKSSLRLINLVFIKIVGNALLKCAYKQQLWIVEKQ